MKKGLVITAILFLFSAPLTYFFILIIDKIVIPKLPFVVVEGTKDGWIAFFGNFLSGITTLIALIFTIESEKRKQKEDEIKYIRPFITTMPILDPNFMRSSNFEKKDYFYHFNVKVENISNNLVKDLQFVSDEVFEFNPETGQYDLNQEELLESKQTYYQIYTVVIDESQIVAPKNEINFPTNLIINNYKKASKAVAESFLVKVLFRYKDVIDRVEYLHKLEYRFNINYTRSGQISLFIDNVKNQILEENPIDKK